MLPKRNICTWIDLQGLGRGIPNHCLPLDFMGLYALSGGMEADTRLRKMARQFMVVDINRRKDYVKTLMLSGKSEAVSGWESSINSL